MSRGAAGGGLRWKADIFRGSRWAGYVALAGALYACDLPQPAANPPELSAEQLVEGGHDLRARAMLIPVVEAEPSNAHAAWLLSKALSGLEDPDGAFKFADRAVSLDGDNAAYHVQLGAVLGRMAEKASIFKQLGLARRAKKELDMGVSLDPKNPDGLLGEMSYYLSAPTFMGGDKAKAGDFAARLAAVDPVRGWLARATIAHEQKDAAAELEFIQRAIAADERDFDARSELANYYLERPERNYSILEEVGCKLLEIDPGRPNGWRVLAEVHVASHCWTQLEQLLAASESFDHEDLSPYDAAADALLREGERLPAARDYLEKYLSQPSDGGEASHAMAHWQMATLLEKEQHRDAAVAQLELALQEDPTLEAARKDLKRLKGK